MSKLAVQLSQISKDYLLWKSPGSRFWLPLIESIYHFIPLHRIGFPDIQSIRKRHRKVFHALHPLSLDIRNGECLGIIGRNGSGKSTLLQIMSGILTPTTGTMSVNGKVAALLELGSGFNAEFTGRENVYLNAAIYGLGRKEVTKLLPKIEEFAGIGEFIDQKVRKYSSGMVVRLAFSVLVNVRPDILIIDEALAVGDSFFVQKCMRWMDEFKKTRTVVLVSHDLSAITRFCDRVAWLDEGRIKYLGSPKKATELYLESNYDSYDNLPAGDDHEEEVERASDRPEALPADIRQPDYREAGEFNIPIADCFLNSTSFGEKKIIVKDVELTEYSNNDKKNLVRGGERVQLKILIEAQQDVVSPIVGFGLKNRLGQELFHDNTYLTSYLTGQSPIKLDKGEQATALFDFIMPYLPSGEYFMFVAVAMGTHEKHTQQHWVHDALKLTSASDRICLGLVGLPMNNVEFYKTSSGS